MATKFDYPIAETPSMQPLEESFTATEVEEELKRLFIRLFREKLADRTYDVNVSGAAHLGSYDLVRRTVNTDGLSLLQGDREEAATRYLYRVWRSRDVNGRGMHFLRTYLQLLLPNLCSVAQVWQDKDAPYPTALHSTHELDGEWIPDPAIHWLTSRVEIALDLTVETRSILTLTDIFRAILPARLVPQFKFWLRFEASDDVVFDAFDFLMQKDVSHRLPWCGRLITDRDDAKWRLGKNGSTTAWRLKGCRVKSESGILIESDIKYGDLPRIGERGRRVDGTWKIPAHGFLCAEFELISVI